MDQIRPNALVIICKGGKLLAQKSIDKHTGQFFGRLIGGGIEFGEKSNEALHRELHEELNVNLKNEKFLAVIENIFEHNGKRGQEITFLYKGDIEEKEAYKEERLKILDKENEFAEWISIRDIKNGKITVFPKETLKYI